MFEVGQRLTNYIEVSRNAVIVEVMSIWVDPDDGDVYYLIKCREIEDDHGHNMFNAWYYDDEVDLVSEAHLDKYYQIVKS